MNNSEPEDPVKNATHCEQRKKQWGKLIRAARRGLPVVAFGSEGFNWVELRDIAAAGGNVVVEGSDGYNWVDLRSIAIAAKKGGGTLTVLAAPSEFNSVELLSIANAGTVPAANVKSYDPVRVCRKI